MKKKENTMKGRQKELSKRKKTQKSGPNKTDKGKNWMDQ